MKNINWKTTTAGLLIIALVGVYLAGKITEGQLTMSIGILTTAGLISAKDHNKQ